VRVDGEPPKMKDIAATNHAALHAIVQGDTIVVCSVADNLLKGAAGGSMQWANRLLGFPESMGLTAPAAGWL
jgi:N-acetyl-gamma-glutamyl-phosphate reductase